MKIKDLCYELENLFDIDNDEIPNEIETYVYRLIDLVLYSEKLISNEELYKNLCNEIIVYHKKLFDEFEIYEKEEDCIKYVAEYVKTGETYMRKLVRRKE